MLDKLKEAVGEVSREYVRGAAWSAERLANALLEDDRSDNAPCEYVDEAVRLVISANPTMGSIANLAWAIKESCYHGLRMADGASAFLEYMSWSRQRMVSKAATLVKDRPITVVTISFSSAVVDVLSSLGSRVRRVYVLESYPGSEGAYAAVELRNRGVESILISDHAVSQHMGEADIVMLGADNVTVDGCVYNKVGSRDLAIIAGYFGKPVIAVFEPYKISSEAKCGEVKLVERQYQVQPWGEVRYFLFDELMRDLVDSIFSVDGLGDNTSVHLNALRRSFEDWTIARLSSARPSS